MLEREKSMHVSGVVRNEGEFATVGNLPNFPQKVATGPMCKDKQPAIQRF